MVRKPRNISACANADGGTATLARGREAAGRAGHGERDYRAPEGRWLRECPSEGSARSWAVLRVRCSGRCCLRRRRPGSCVARQAAAQRRGRVARSLRRVFMVDTYAEAQSDAALRARGGKDFPYNCLLFAVTARSRHSTNLSASNGLRKKPAAPARSARTRTVSSASAVRKITGRARPCAIR